MTERQRGQGENLEVVFRAPDETTANLVRGLLIGEGIPAVIESRQVAWMDGIMTAGEGYWGDVVVPNEHAERSRELIQAYRNKAGVEDNEVSGGEDASAE